MTLFVLLAAVLTALTVVLLTRPLWRRSGASIPAAATDGSRPARWPAAWIGAMALFVLGVAALGYRLVGSPNRIAPAPSASAAKSEARAASMSADEAQQISAMVDSLAQRLKAEPGDADGWKMLARSYVVLLKYDDAVNAYKSASALRPGDPTLLADFAYALAMSHHRNLQGEPVALLERALAIDAHNPKALALAGTAAFDRKDYAGAIRYWETLAKTQPPDSVFALRVQPSIAEARRLAGMSMGGAPASAASTASGR